MQGINGALSLRDARCVYISPWRKGNISASLFSLAWLNSTALWDMRRKLDANIYNANNSSVYIGVQEFNVNADSGQSVCARWNYISSLFSPGNCLDLLSHKQLMRLTTFSHCVPQFSFDPTAGLNMSGLCMWSWLLQHPLPLHLPLPQEGINYEVRRYDGAKYASVCSEGRSFDQAATEGVKRLLMYKGGSNDRGEVKNRVHLLYQLIHQTKYKNTLTLSGFSEGVSS